MDPLDELREKIPGFPGYGGDLERRRSDELVRSYLGEALADLTLRCGPLSTELTQRVDALLLRVGFADPKAFAVHNVFARAQPAAGDDGALAMLDVAVVAAADQASSIAPDAVAQYLDDVTATLDRRDATMRAAATKP
jgi:hypothetical protein